VIAALSKDSRVVLAQPLQEFHTLTTDGAGAAPSASAPPSTSAPPSRAAAPSAAGAHYNDPLYDMQTNMTALGIPRAHERTQGAGVRIALIDTGVDVDHPDLLGAIVHTHSFTGRPASAGGRRG